MSRRKKQPAPSWLDESVYEPKRQRTVLLVKQAVDALVKQREQDRVTRISLNTIIAMSKRLDPEEKGIAHTAILENEEAYTYYKRFRTTGKPKKRVHDIEVQVPKLDRDLTRVQQRYAKLRKAELIEQRISVEQQYAQLHERWLLMIDKVLEWQLRAEQAERRLAQLATSKSGDLKHDV